MEQFEQITIQTDPVIRAINGDASSPVYGGSLREGLRLNEQQDDYLHTGTEETSSAVFLVAAFGFLLVSFLLW